MQHEPQIINRIVEKNKYVDKLTGFTFANSRNWRCEDEKIRWRLVSRAESSRTESNDDTQKFDNKKVKNSVAIIAASGK